MAKKPHKFAVRRHNNKKRKAEAKLALMKSQNVVTAATASSQSDKRSKDPETANRSNKADAVRSNEGSSPSKKRKSGGITEGVLTKKIKKDKKVEDTDDDTDEDSDDDEHDNEKRQMDTKGTQDKAHTKVKQNVDVKKKNKSNKKRPKK